MTTAATPTRPRTFATRLVEEDKVVAVIGGSTTGTTLAMMPVFEEAKIPFISLRRGDRDRRAGAQVRVQDAAHRPDGLPEDLRGHAARKITKIGIISSTDGFGKSMREQCLEGAKDGGVEFVADETYGPRDADMTPQLTKIKNTPGVQALVHTGFGQPRRVVTRNVRADRPDESRSTRTTASPRRATSSSPAGPRTACACRPRRCSSPTSSPTTIRRSRWSSPTSRPTRRPTNQPVSTFGGHAYDGFFILIEAIEARRRRRPGEGARRDREDQGLHRHGGHRQHVAERPPRPRPLGLQDARDQERRLDRGEGGVADGSSRHPGRGAAAIRDPCA